MKEVKKKKLSRINIYLLFREPPMNALNNFLRTTHNRNILLTTIRSLNNEKQLVYKYDIPLYDDTPKGKPIIEITNHSMIITFTNQDLLQNPCRK
jgi:hypothetical protein